MTAGGGVLALLVLAGMLSSCGRPASHPAGSDPVTARATARDGADTGAGTARALLATVAVKGRAAKTGYSRAQFGTAWTDDTTDPLGHNGCDTRNDILRRDLTGIALKPGSHGCTVLTGTLRDPYTAGLLRFDRTSAASAVQIDHVVALGDAWQTGAARWSAQIRTELANDPLELLAVDGPTNEAKGDGDAATWLPPNKAYRCAYVARQVAVKARYRLWMTQAEHDAVVRVLDSCPDQLAPTETGSPDLSPAAHAATPRTLPRTSSSATPAVSASPTPPPVAAVSYPNCAAVRAAGAAPLHRGDPGYSAQLDRDGDGTACE